MSKQSWFKSRLKTMCVGLLIGVLALALLSLDSVPASRTDEGESAEIVAARADAAVALQKLERGDLMALGEELASHQADPAFASFFTEGASPRELGDVLATVGEPDGLGLKDDVDPTSYDAVLTDLADTLALATQNTGEFVLPAAWADDFATYTTNPDARDDEAVDEERAAQDQANKQNLLLLLSRGRWGTEFLMTVTRAFWGWEHDPSAEGDPWPGVPMIFIPDGGTDARYAPAPNGAYLGDGMVALMAALTANPEAAGWAFVDFQPGTRSVSIEGDDHQMGEFAHYLFFERTESGIADSDDAGASTMVTALTSAVRATGGSYGEGALGPRADAYILEDHQEALEDEVERQQNVWYKKAGSSAMAGVHFLREHGHSILDVAASIPVVGAPADVANGAWSAAEGDWDAAGLSAAGLVPVLGDAVAAAAKVTKTVKVLKRGLSTADKVVAAGDLPKGATHLGDDVLQFQKSEDLRIAIDDPLPGMTYQVGETAYRATPDGKSITRISGPDLPSPTRRSRVKRVAVQAAKTSKTVFMKARDVATLAEQAGLVEYGLQVEVSVDPQQVFAHVDGMASGRFYEGVVLQDDGTYEAIDVLIGDEERSSTQIEFDEGISVESPALSTSLLGETVKITSVVEVRVVP